MYFFKRKGKQVLDLTGNLILSHNDALVKSRIKSAAPRHVEHVKYILDIPSMSRWDKTRATFRAIAFIWGPSQALKAPLVIVENPQ